MAQARTKASSRKNTASASRQSPSKSKLDQGNDVLDELDIDADDAAETLYAAGLVPGSRTGKTSDSSVFFD